MTAPSPSSWDEDALADETEDCQNAADAALLASIHPNHFASASIAEPPTVKGGQGRSPKDIIEDGTNALIGCFGWAALVFAAFVVWVIVESIGGAR